MKENHKNQEAESSCIDPGDSFPKTSMSNASDVLLKSFSASVEKLEPNDRAAVMEQFDKLKGAFELLGKSFDKLLSSEEGRRLFDQEVKKRQGA